MSGFVTAREIVGRIQRDVGSRGVEWAATTVDTFKAGDPDRTVTGIATTWMATSGTIRAAADSACNFLITHEPTFWNHLDVHPDWHEGDPYYLAKSKLIEQTGMTIWRFHDHNHSGFDPDPVMWALFAKLGVVETTTNGGMFRWVSRVPEMSLRQLAEYVARSLGTNNVRVVGDPDLPVRSFGLGGHNLDSCLMGNEDADAVLVGEVREWDTFEYYRDASILGIKRGLIVISHRDLETWGAGALANWLARVVPEVPVVAVQGADPFELLRAS